MINVFNSPIEASSLDEFHEERGDEQDKLFDKARKRPKVEYTPEGRKKVDGKVEELASPNALWTTTISRGVANDWREKAEGGRLQRARQYVAEFTYDCRLFLHKTSKTYGTPLLLLLNVVLATTVLYMFKVIIW